MKLNLAQYESLPSEERQRIMATLPADHLEALFKGKTIDTNQFTPVASAPVQISSAAPAVKVNPDILVLRLTGVLLFFTGGFMFCDGVLAEITEMGASQPSAIRATENVCQYGLGLVVLALGLILYGLAAVLKKP